MTLREFLKYLQSERIIPSGKKVFGQETGYTRREPVSILEMEQFIEKIAGHDQRKLEILARDVEWYIRDEEFEAEVKNIQNNLADQSEYYIAGSEGEYHPDTQNLERFLRLIKYQMEQAEPEVNAAIKQTEPGPHLTTKQVAKNIKSNTKSGDDTYSEADIIFALNYFKDHYKQSKNYTDIFSLIREDGKCPTSLKPEKANKAILRWFHHYENEAGITLKD